MKPQLILGIALIVIGVVLFIVGMNASDSIADQLSETFTGRFTQDTMWYIIGGAVMGVIGLFLVVVNARNSAG